MDVVDTCKQSSECGRSIPGDSSREGGEQIIARGKRPGGLFAARQPHLRGDGLVPIAQPGKMPDECRPWFMSLVTATHNPSTAPLVSLL